MGVTIRGINYEAGQSFHCYNTVDYYYSEDGSSMGKLSQNTTLYFHSISSYANQSWALHDYKLATSAAATSVRCFVDENAFPYGVYYNANGGSGSVHGMQEKLYGINLTTWNGSGLSKTGYYLSGWNTAANGTGASYSLGGAYSTEATNTLYARWTPNTYTVTFNPNGGTLTGNSSYPIRYESADYWDISGAIPIRSGYKFLGWYTTASGGTQVYDAGGICTNDGTYWDDVWVYPGNVTFYAQWELLEYTIYFEANGGNIPSTQVVATAGSYITMPDESQCTRRGAKFLGWTNSPASSSPIFGPQGGQLLVITNGQTWYALWLVGDTVYIKLDDEWIMSEKIYIKYQGSWLGG